MNTVLLVLGLIGGILTIVSTAVLAVNHGRKTIQDDTVETLEKKVSAQDSWIATLESDIRRKDQQITDLKDRLSTCEGREQYLFDQLKSVPQFKELAKAMTESFREVMKSQAEASNSLTKVVDTQNKILEELINRRVS